MKTNKNGVKLLAAVAIFAMVVAAFAIVLPSGGDVDANEEIVYTDVSTSEGLKEELDKETTNIHVISSGILTFSEAGTYSVDNLKITPGGYALKLGDGVDLTINESLVGEFGSQIQLSNGSKLTINGSISCTTIYGISDKTEGIAGLGTFSSAEGNKFSTWITDNQMFITGTYSGWMMTNNAGLATVYVPTSKSLIANDVFVGPGFDLVIYGEASGSFTTSAGSGGAPTDSKTAFQDKSTVGTAGISIEGLGVLSGTVTLDANETITLAQNVKFDATVNGPSGNSLSGKLVAGEGGLTIKGGSLTIDGNITTGSYDGVNITVTGDSIYIDGTIGQDVTVTIAPSTVVTIAENANLTNSGSIVNQGTLVVRAENQNLGAVDNSNGSINTAVGVTVEGTIAGNRPTPVGTEPGSFAMGDHLESDYTVISYAFLTQDLTIPEGITLTVKGTLALNGYNLIVKGTLSVESKGKIVGYEAAGEDKGIVLSETGVIANAGIIGADSLVIVKDEQQTPATVTMKNVVGAKFGLTEVIYDDGGKKIKNVLTVSGEISKKGDASSFTVIGAYIGDLIVGEVATISITGTVLEDATVVIGSKAVVNELTITMNNGAYLNIEGKITAGTITMTNDTTAIVNGKVAAEVEFKAQTGEYNTYNIAGKRNVAEDALAADSISSVKLENLVGVTIEITSKTYTVKDGATSVSKTNQMMNVYGTASITKTEAGVEESSATMTIAKKVYVPAGETLALLNDKMKLVGLNASGDTIVTDGTLSIAKELSAVSGNKVTYNGTAYSIKTTTATGSVTTYHYTTFDAAFAIIDTVEGKKVTINGGYTFDKDITISAGQIVAFDTAKISKDAKITVEADGELSTGFSANGIKGILVVMEDGSCIPTPGSYEVKSTDANNNITYSGAEIAIANAEAGSTIYIVNQVTFEEKVTIPAGVTVDVAATAEIIVENGLSVNGKVLNKGTITMNKGDLDIAGEVDDKETIAFEDTNNKHNVNVTGTLTTNAPITDADAKINAAYYENSVRIVYTSVASAVDAVSKMTIPVAVTVDGKVSESSDITLVEGMKLIISGEVTLKSIRLVAGSTLDTTTDADAALTADIISAVGKADTTGAVSDAIVGLKKVTDVDFTVTYNESNTTYIMTATAATAYTGDLVFKTGTVSLSIGSTVEFAETKTLAVSSGATVNISGDSLYLKDVTGKYFSNEGTLNVNSNAKFTGVLGGDVVVKKGKELTLASIDNATTGVIDGSDVITYVIGNITITADESTPATVKIDTFAFIGTAPETLGAAGSLVGKITNLDSAFVIVFNGSTFSTTIEDVDSTSYTVNGTAFATVYGDAEITVIDPIVEDLDDLDGTVTWYAGETKITDQNVGDFESVSANVDYATIDVFKISAGPGLIVYIDDFLVGTSIDTLKIGTHTITVYIEPGYEGTPVIKFNGTTVTDGKIVLTTENLDMKNVLVVTGATPIVTPTPEPTPTPVEPTKDDSLGITEYLLIVLVILAAILVVVVAIRMMRS